MLNFIDRYFFLSRKKTKKTSKKEEESSDDEDVFKVCLKRVPLPKGEELI